MRAAASRIADLREIPRAARLARALLKPAVMNLRAHRVPAPGALRRPPVRLPSSSPVTLLVACPRVDGGAWDAYTDGLAKAFAAIGASALGVRDVPKVPTRVILAIDEDGRTVAGIRLRRGTEMQTYPGLEGFGERLALRAGDGVDESGGVWASKHARGRGLAVALMKGVIAASAELGSRWIVALANASSLRCSLEAGFEEDAELRRLPFPDERFESTLVWYDHGARRASGKVASW